MLKREFEMATIEISCVEVWREISNYLDEEVSPELRERMEAHFKACAHCTAVLDGTRNVVELVGDGRLFQMPEGFSKRLYKRLRELPLRCAPLREFAADSGRNGSATSWLSMSTRPERPRQLLEDR